MSHFENVVQAPSHDHLILHRPRPIPCGRCCTVIEYDRGAEWSVVNELVNEHWKTCPGKPHVKPACMAHAPASLPDTAIVLPPPIATTQRSSSTPATEPANSSDNIWVSVGYERKRRTLEQRKFELEQDEYAQNVTTKSVVCRGCHKEISLDKRSMYYPGLWHKHRRKCPNIERLERAKNRVQQVPYDIDIPAFDGNVYGDVPPLSSTERYNFHSSATTHQLIRLYDSEGPSSEDEDEDEDLLPQEPFPTLNNAFYQTERLRNGTDVWVYRYATEDEITTNLFHGQDEPYARLGGRPSTYLSLQTGGQGETSRCIMKARVEQTISDPDNFRPNKELSKAGKDIAPHTLPWQTDPMSLLIMRRGIP